VDENPFRSPRSDVEWRPAPKSRTRAEPLRFRDVFLIASAVTFMGTAFLPAIGSGRYRSVDSASLESALARLPESEYYSGLMLGVSLLAGALAAYLYKLFGDFRVLRRRNS
jgi:hypothetical protein